MKLFPVLLCFIVLSLITSTVFAVENWAIRINKDDVPLKIFNDLYAHAEKKIQQEKELADRNSIYSQFQLYNLKNEIIKDLIERTLVYQKAKEMSFTAPEYYDLLGSNTSEDSDPYQNLEKQITSKLSVDVVISNEAILHFYNQNLSYFQIPDRISVRQIITNSEEKAQTIYHRLLIGNDFAALAKQESIDPLTASQGGKVGQVDRSFYSPTIGDVLFSLPDGSLSPIMKGAEGYAIFLIEGHLPSYATPLSDVRSTISEFLKRERSQTIYHTWLSTVYKKARININPDLFPPIIIDNNTIETSRIRKHMDWPTAISESVS